MSRSDVPYFVFAVAVLAAMATYCVAVDAPVPATLLALLCGGLLVAVATGVRAGPPPTCRICGGPVVRDGCDRCGTAAEGR